MFSLLIINSIISTNLCHHLHQSLSIINKFKISPSVALRSNEPQLPCKERTLLLSSHLPAKHLKLENLKWYFGPFTGPMAMFGFNIALPFCKKLNISK